MLRKDQSGLFLKFIQIIDIGFEGMRASVVKTEFDVLEQLIQQQTQAALNPLHPINDGIRKSLQAESRKLEALMKSTSFEVDKNRNDEA